LDKKRNNRANYGKFVSGRNLCPVATHDLSLIFGTTKMDNKKLKKYKIKLTLNLEEIDALDDILDLFLDGDFSEEGINREALIQIQEQVNNVMSVVNRKLGFTASDKDPPKYLM
jgi:hypothetical protein